MPFIRGQQFLPIVMMMIGCATIEELPTVPSTRPSGQGIYHKVHKGETLWRIAKNYDVSLEQIVRTNSIPNAAIVEENQLIFVPGAEAVREIPAAREDPNVNEFAWPLKGRVLSYYGNLQAGYHNRGLRIKARSGEDVRASRQGKVVFADYLSGYEHMIILDHADGYYSVYGQNARLTAGMGDQVFKGDVIAEVGRARPHAFLYFEIRKNASPDNPLYYLPKL